MPKLIELKQSLRIHLKQLNSRYTDSKLIFMKTNLEIKTSTYFKHFDRFQ